MNKIIKEFIELTKKNLENSPRCGGWCIRCALANAMGKFGKPEDRISFSEALRQVATKNITTVSKRRK